MKALKKFEINGTYFNIIKVMYDKPRANIIFNGEKLKASQLKSVTRMSTLTTSIQHRTGSPSNKTRAVRPEKNIKGIPTVKEVKLLLFADDIIYIDNPKVSTDN